ncbi:MAG: GvpL/GvpF family gas vesicle protein [Alphaproteobacteria bacterium]
MAITAIKTADDGLLLLGITHAELADVIGLGGAEFSGLRVRPIVEGPVCGLVAAIPRPANWIEMLRKRISPLFDFAPILSAVSSVLPIVPLRAGTGFDGEGAIRKMLAGRAEELDEIVLRHSAFLECELTAEFDQMEAAADLMSSTPVGMLKASSVPEFTLVQQTLVQSVAGRRAAFIARLRRIINDIAADMMAGQSGDGAARLSRRLLIARSARKDLLDRIRALKNEVGAGARLRLGHFMPPVSFRELEIRGADVDAVHAARAALGVGDTADRMTIRVAYRRSIERIAPTSGAAQDTRLDRLGAQFGLLDLVAEGQIRAARRSEAPVCFDAKSLADTWLIKFHIHDVADRVA